MIKSEKSRKYYRKCSNDFAVDCIILYRFKSQVFAIVYILKNKLIIYYIIYTCMFITPFYVNYLFHIKQFQRQVSEFYFITSKFYLIDVSSLFLSFYSKLCLNRRVVAFPRRLVEASRVDYFFIVFFFLLSNFTGEK